MTPRQVVELWIHSFNAGDAAALASLYLEWRDPKGLRGCGFCTVRDGRIAFQRGYWDRLSFLRLHGVQVPNRNLTDT